MNSPKKKILILYTSIGMGHKFIALNIAYHLKREGYETEMFDVLQNTDGWMVNSGKSVHKIINEKFPFVWSAIYKNNLFNRLTMPMREFIAGRNIKQVKNIVQKFQPDCIISTQASGSAAVSYMKQQKIFTGKFVIAFSDYHLHDYWIYKNVDFYLANITEQKQEMAKQGIDPHKILVAGITLMPQMFHKKNRDEYLTDLDLPLNKKIVVIASGSLGIGFDPSDQVELVKTINHYTQSIFCVIMTGKNQRAFKFLNSKNLPNTKILGFFQPATKLYAAANLLVTKPGGISIAENLQCETSIIITHFLPGQEELNLSYLTNKNLVTTCFAKNNLDGLAKCIIESAQSAPKINQAASNEITQRGNEGTVLIKAINTLLENGNKT